MSVPIVADSEARLMKALRPQRIACRKVVMAELQERYRAELASAGFIRRWILKRRMHREADALVCQRLRLPAWAMVFDLLDRCD